MRELVWTSARERGRRPERGSIARVCLEPLFGSCCLFSSHVEVSRIPCAQCANCIIAHDVRQRTRTLSTIVEQLSVRTEETRARVTKVRHRHAEALADERERGWGRWGRGGG